MMKKGISLCVSVCVCARVCVCSCAAHNGKFEHDKASTPYSIQADPS